MKVCNADGMGAGTPMLEVLVCHFDILKTTFYILVESMPSLHEMNCREKIQK